MPSIIPGYEYDIFISHRQKDNQSDQWVTKYGILEGRDQCHLQGKTSPSTLMKIYNLKLK